MAKSFKIRTILPKVGNGPKIVAGTAYMSPAQEAIHSEDIKLRKIHFLSVTSPAIGTYIHVTIPQLDKGNNRVQEGSMGNYASLNAVQGFKAIGKNGSHAAIAGSHSFGFIAIGE